MQMYTIRGPGSLVPQSWLATDARLRASQRPEITWPSLSLVMGMSPN